MRSKAAVLEAGHLSDFDRRLERFQSISDIECQTGKPITMPTANVAKKQSAKVSFLILSVGCLGHRRLARILGALKGVSARQDSQVNALLSFQRACPKCGAGGPKRESHQEALRAWNGSNLKSPRKT